MPKYITVAGWGIRGLQLAQHDVPAIDMSQWPLIIINSLTAIKFPPGDHIMGDHVWSARALQCLLGQEKDVV